MNKRSKGIGAARNAVTFGVLLALLVLVAVFCVSVRTGSREGGEDLGGGETLAPADRSETSDRAETAEEPRLSDGELSEQASAADRETAEDRETAAEGEEFTQVDETVTARDLTNLRSEPTMTSVNIVKQLLNGETLTRTGINEKTGWSRLVWEGQTVYAVSEYLTTDLDYQPAVGAASRNFFLTADRHSIAFRDCDDMVTPKEYVNLRSEPSTSQGDATVRAHLEAGERVRRTGYSEEAGWSRVEYNGETLYVVSSYVETVQEEAQ